jgi:hypothetical protein
MSLAHCATALPFSMSVSDHVYERDRSISGEASLDNDGSNSTKDRTHEVFSSLDPTSDLLFRPETALPFISRCEICVISPVHPNPTSFVISLASGWRRVPRKSHEIRIKTSTNLRKITDQLFVTSVEIRPRDEVPYNGRHGPEPNFGCRMEAGSANSIGVRQDP